jgi:hypothetical protein
MDTKAYNRDGDFVTMLQILQKCQCGTKSKIMQRDFNFIRADTNSLGQVHLLFIVYTTYHRLVVPPIF